MDFSWRTSDVLKGVGDTLGDEGAVAGRKAEFFFAELESEFAFEDVEDLQLFPVGVDGRALAGGDDLFEDGNGATGFGGGYEAGDVEFGDHVREGFRFGKNSLWW